MNCEEFGGRMKNRNIVKRLFAFILSIGLILTNIPTDYAASASDYYSRYSKPATLEEAKANLDKASSALNTSGTDTSALEAELNKVTEEISNKEASIAQLEKQISTLKSHAQAAISAEIASVEKQLITITDQRDNLINQNLNPDEYQIKLSELNQGIENINKQLTTLRAVDLSNTDSYSSISYLISDLKQLSGLNSDISTVKGQIAGLQEQKTSLQGQIADAMSSKNSLESDYQIALAEYEEFKGKEVSIPTENSTESQDETSQETVSETAAESLAETSEESVDETDKEVSSSETKGESVKETSKENNQSSISISQPKDTKPAPVGNRSTKGKNADKVIVSKETKSDAGYTIVTVGAVSKDEAQAMLEAEKLEEENKKKEATNPQTGVGNDMTIYYGVLAISIVVLLYLKRQENVK